MHFPLHSHHGTPSVAGVDFLRYCSARAGLKSYGCLDSTPLQSVFRHFRIARTVYVDGQRNRTSILSHIRRRDEGTKRPAGGRKWYQARPSRCTEERRLVQARATHNHTKIERDHLERNRSVSDAVFRCTLVVFRWLTTIHTNSPRQMQRHQCSCPFPHLRAPTPHTVRS